MITSDYLGKLGLEMVKEKIGQGGSAIVHKCRVLERTKQEFPLKGSFIAVKEFNLEMLATPGQLARIDQEAKIGASLQSPYFAKIYSKDLGEGVPPSHCVLFMEWIDGPTLSAWVSKNKSSKQNRWDFKREICQQIVKGVKDLHDSGIHHRDLKPENIMLRSASQPVIMDVGVAEIARGSEHTMHTRVKDFLGSVRYASPQFLRGDEFDPSDDVYSLGCTFLELVTGLQPYHQEERKVLLPSIVMQGPPDVPESISSFMAGLDVIIRGSTHSDRSRRPTLDELAEFFQANKPTNYVELERIRQYEDKRGWSILQVDGYDVFVDIGRSEILSYKTYKVIRLGNPMTAPSTGRINIPQRLIGSAKHLHTSGSLAHFRFVPEIDSHNKANLTIHGLPDVKPDMAKVGDHLISS